MMVARVSPLADGDAPGLVAVAPGSSPPSPVLLLPPTIRFTASQRGIWASVEMEPGHGTRGKSASRFPRPTSGPGQRESPWPIELELEQAAQRQRGSGR